MVSEWINQPPNQDQPAPPAFLHSIVQGPWQTTMKTMFRTESEALHAAEPFLPSEKVAFTTKFPDAIHGGWPIYLQNWVVLVVFM